MAFPTLPVRRIGPDAALEVAARDFDVAEKAALERGHASDSAELIGYLFTLRRLGFNRREAATDRDRFFGHMDRETFDLILEGVFHGDAAR